MLTLLAQIPNATPAGMSSWLTDGAAILAVVLLVLNIVQHFRAKPPLHNQFANREDTERRFDLIDKKIEAIRVENRTQFDDILKAGEERAIKLHDRINDILKAVSRLEGKMEERS